MKDTIFGDLAKVVCRISDVGCEWCSGLSDSFNSLINQSLIPYFKKYN